MELSRDMERAKRALDDNASAYQQLRDRVANSEMYAAQMRDQEAGMASDAVGSLREELGDVQALVGPRVCRYAPVIRRLKHVMLSPRKTATFAKATREL